MGTEVVEYIGVYHADGGLVGEVSYVIGKLLGTAHCALCDITHSPIRRKPEWDRMVSGLGVPFTLLHRNELTADVAAAVVGCGTPVVLARGADGGLAVALTASQLDELDGSVAALGEALADR